MLCIKKMLALLTVGCICLSVSISASAAIVSSQGLLEEGKVNQISIAINFVEKTKSAYGLDDVDFNDLELGSSIVTYEYVNGDFKVLGEMMPIFSGDEMVASAFNVGNGTYSVETLLASDINNMGFDTVAIVYDRDEVYLFNGDDFVLLEKSDICISERDDININTLKNEEHHTSTTDIRNNTRVRLKNNKAQEKILLPFVKCDVTYVTQNPYKNLCWAACIAMIKNYKSGTTLTAPDVSRAYFGTFKDQGLSGQNVQNCMQNKYGLNYTYRNTAPKENVIFSNLAKGDPVIGGFIWTSGGVTGGHMCVIFLDDPFSCYISLLDPKCGSVAASGSNGTFSYVSSISGNTLTLMTGLCKSWVYE